MRYAGFSHFSVNPEPPLSRHPHTLQPLADYGIVTAPQDAPGLEAPPEARFSC